MRNPLGFDSRASFRIYSITEPFVLLLLNLSNLYKTFNFQISLYYCASPHSFDVLHAIQSPESRSRGIEIVEINISSEVSNDAMDCKLFIELIFIIHFFHEIYFL